MARTARALIGGFVFLAVTSLVFAQGPPLKLPEVSPHASVSQTIGLTDIAIDYHRPGVNDRVVWGELVPWDAVWRAGANENTTISFSSPVEVEGHELAAGTYGLHLIPHQQGPWTLILNRQSKAWGSFAYDSAYDALRVDVRPQPSPFRERLAYEFDEPTANSTIAALEWEKLRVPFTIDVDVPAVVTADLAEQLTGLPQFFWQPWNQAAGWVAANGGDLDRAMEWVDRSIGINPTFQNLQTKAQLLEGQGNAAEAATLRARAMTIATETDLNAYGYQLLGQNRIDDAIEIFRRNVREHPSSWNTYDSLADAYGRKGQTRLAIDNYEKAKKMTKDPRQVTRIDQELQKLRSR